MNKKLNENELKDNRLKDVNGGTSVGGVCGPDYPTTNNNEYVGSANFPGPVISESEFPDKSIGVIPKYYEN